MKLRSLKSRAAAIVAVAALAGGMAACGGGAPGEVVDGPWEDVVAAAENEGRVVVYTSMPQLQNDRLVEAFNEQYPGISVTVTRGGPELAARTDAEIGSGAAGADVFIFSDPNWFAGRDDALLDADGPSAEGIRDDAWSVDGKAAVVSSSPFSVFLWNTNRFPDGFSTWEELADPATAGAIGMRSDMSTSFAAFLDFLEQERGSDYIAELGQRGPRFYASSVPMGQAVASGEIGVTPLSTPAIVLELQNQGAPVESYVPSPGFWIEFAAGALSKSRTPNAARVFVDFALSDAGQAALNGGGLGGASRDGVDGAIELGAWVGNTLGGMLG